MIKRADKLVMDNCGMRHGRLAQETPQDLSCLHGFDIVFQPPYSRNLNEPAISLALENGFHV